MEELKVDEHKKEFVEPQLVKYEERLADVTGVVSGSGFIVDDDQLPT